MLKSQKQSKLDNLCLQQEFSMDQILKMDNAQLEQIVFKIEKGKKIKDKSNTDTACEDSYV